MGGFNVHCNMVYFCSNINLYKILATYSIPVTVHVCVCIANMSVKIVDFLNAFLYRLRRVLPALSSWRGNEV